MSKSHVKDLCSANNPNFPICTFELWVSDPGVGDYKYKSEEICPKVMVKIYVVLIFFYE